MLPLNLNLQLNATSALWANDSTLENTTQAHSKIWLIKYKKERKGKRQELDILSSGGGRAPRTCCWRRRWAPRACDELACDTHTFQCRSLKLDMQETSATEVCASTFSFFLGEKGSAPRTCCWRSRWAPRTCTYDDPSTTTHPLQHRSLELHRQETGATEVCESSFRFCKLVPVWPFLHLF